MCSALSGEKTWNVFPRAHLRGAWTVCGPEPHPLRLWSYNLPRGHPETTRPTPAPCRATCTRLLQRWAW